MVSALLFLCQDFLNLCELLSVTCGMCSWLQESLKALKECVDGDNVRRASELRHALLLSGPNAAGASANTNEGLPE